MDSIGDLAMDLPDTQRHKQYRQRSRTEGNIPMGDFTQSTPQKHVHFANGTKGQLQLKPNKIKRNKESFLDINFCNIGIFGYLNVLAILLGGITAYWIMFVKEGTKVSETVQRVDKTTTENFENSHLINEEIFKKLEMGKLERKDIKNELKGIKDWLGDLKIEMTKLNEAQRSTMINMNNQHETSTLKRSKIEEKLMVVETNVGSLGRVLADNIVIVGRNNLKGN